MENQGIGVSLSVGGDKNHGIGVSFSVGADINQGVGASFSNGWETWGLWSPISGCLQITIVIVKKKFYK